MACASLHRLHGRKIANENGAAVNAMEANEPHVEVSLPNRLLQGGHLA